MAIEAIFFDLDNTLLDFNRAERAALQKVLPGYGITPTPEVLARYHELNDYHWKQLELGNLTREQVMQYRFDRLLEELGGSGDGARVSDAYENQLAAGENFYIEGARELLDDLKEKYMLCLATNGAAHVQRLRLHNSGLDKDFAHIFISEELGADKPAAAFYDVCFAALPGIKREETVMVGDSLTSDIKGGKAAGMRTVWYCPKGHPRPARAQMAAIPDKIIETLGELKTILAIG